MEEVCVLLFYRKENVKTYLYSHRNHFEENHRFRSHKIIHTFQGLTVRKRSVSEHVGDTIANYENEFIVKPMKIAYKPKCAIFIDILGVKIMYRADCLI